MANLIRRMWWLSVRLLYWMKRSDRRSDSTIGREMYRNRNIVVVRNRGDIMFDVIRLIPESHEAEYLSQRAMLSAARKECDRLADVYALIDRLNG